MTAFLHHQSGERIQDRYEVLGELGSGAFGTVYKCRDLELDTLVAIKELHVLDAAATEGNEREAALAQFRREAVNLSHLRHPHIVSGHYQPHAGTWLACPVCGDTFRGAKACPHHNTAPIVVRQRHYLVMEYLDGPDLSQAALAEGGALDIERALRYIRQITQALQVIHARRLLHRDIKPENVRLRVAGDDAVLLDFGIATETGEAGDFSTRQHRHTSGGGTLGYAPESASERRLPDARSDIHALGMTLYAILSGRDPLESDDLIAMRANRPTSFNANIPPHIEALILRSIDSNPAQRPADAGEFLRDLNGPMTNVPVAPVAVSTAAASAVTVAVAPPFAFRSGARASDVAQLVRSARAKSSTSIPTANIRAWKPSRRRRDWPNRRHWMFRPPSSTSGRCRMASEKRWS
jgi:serine/threonine protein kinase